MDSLESFLSFPLLEWTPERFIRWGQKIGPACATLIQTIIRTRAHQIHSILSETRWRIEGKDGAAAILGLHPSTLRARIHKLGILRPEAKASG